MNIAHALESLLAHGAVAIAHPHRQTLSVRGADSARWLQALITADVLAMREGAQCYALLLEKKGRIVSDLYLQKRANGYDVSIHSSVFAQVVETFDRHVIMEDVELQTTELGVLVEEFISGTSAYPHGSAQAAFSWVPEPRHNAVDAESALGRGLRAVLRAPAFAQEFDARDYPQEAGIESPTVSMSKGCYLGQEVVCMIQMRGSISRKLRAVLSPDGQISGDLHRDSVAAGAMRSLGQWNGTNLGFAMLKRTFGEPGVSLHDAAGHPCTVL